VAELAREIHSAEADNRQVFHARRSYSMAVDMPNLNSVAGSWVIHFAELATAPGAGSAELVPPAIVLKADPAYPADLMRQHVEGTVTLYAIIHADGSVGGVRVLEGVDSRLDHYAEAALQECKFRPATRNGAAVELEAVVQIPFRSQPLR
jgi:TonB family protein